MKMIGVVSLAIAGLLGSSCGSSVQGGSRIKVSVENDTSRIVMSQIAAGVYHRLYPSQVLTVAVNERNDPQQLRVFTSGGHPAECLVIDDQVATGSKHLFVSSASACQSGIRFVFPYRTPST